MAEEEGDKGQLIIACSSDRGLCGGVHSSIGRFLKAELAVNPNTKVVIIGDKVRNILQRFVTSHVLRWFSSPIEYDWVDFDY